MWTATLVCVVAALLVADPWLPVAPSDHWGSGLTSVDPDDRDDLGVANRGFVGSLVTETASALVLRDVASPRAVRSTPAHDRSPPPA